MPGGLKKKSLRTELDLTPKQKKIKEAVLFNYDEEIKVFEWS